jgi:hypothetical protein
MERCLFYLRIRLFKNFHIFPSGVISSVTRILLRRASSSGVMRPSEGCESKGGSVSVTVAAVKGDWKNGGIVEGAGDEGGAVKTPARTELRKKSSGRGGPIFWKKKGRSVRGKNGLPSSLPWAASAVSVVCEARPKSSRAVASIVWKASDMSKRTRIYMKKKYICNYDIVTLGNAAHLVCLCLEIRPDRLNSVSPGCLHHQRRTE